MHFITDNSGEGGIRTFGTVARTTVFETGPFNHSGTSPDDALTKIKQALPGKGSNFFSIFISPSYCRNHTHREQIKLLKIESL